MAKNKIVDILCVVLIVISIVVIAHRNTQTKHIAQQTEKSVLSNTIVADTIQHERLEKSCLVFNHSVIDFGTVPNDTLLVADFVVTNTCDDTSYIEDVNPECTCTSYLVSKYKVPGNDTALIRMTLDTHNKYGETKVYATIKDNSMEMQILMLKVNVVNR